MTSDEIIQRIETLFCIEGDYDGSAPPAIQAMTRLFEAANLHGPLHRIAAFTLVDKELRGANVVIVAVHTRGTWELIGADAMKAEDDSLLDAVNKLKQLRLAGDSE